MFWQLTTVLQPRPRLLFRSRLATHPIVPHMPSVFVPGNEVPAPAYGPPGIAFAGVLRDACMPQTGPLARARPDVRQNIPGLSSTQATRDKGIGSCSYCAENRLSHTERIFQGEGVFQKHFVPEHLAVLRRLVGSRPPNWSRRPRGQSELLCPDASQPLQRAPWDEALVGTARFRGVRVLEHVGLCARRHHPSIGHQLLRPSFLRAMPQVQSCAVFMCAMQSQNPIQKMLRVQRRELKKPGVS